MFTSSRRRFLAGAACAVTLLVACNDDRVTAPHRPGLRTVVPLPRGSTTHPKNSPDLPVGQFAARDTTNASTSTGPGFGFRVKWLTRYKVSVSDWADQVANGYPLAELHPVPLSGMILVRSGANADRSVAYSHPQAGPAVTYLQLNANDTVQGVTRSGYSAGNKAGTMPDSTPFWCGPAYPAHPPCYYYYGSPGSATFERLDAEVELTADSTSAGYGSNVKFVLQAVPAYVEGQPMAISIDSTAWIPDEDSLGGDWNDASLTGACTWDNANYWVTRQCTRTIRSSGTLRVRGGINGKYFEKTRHISRTDAHPIVTAKRYFVTAGQRDTFTVRMSDGSAFSSLRWTWAADSGTAQSQIVCALYANPCNGSIIRESGNMRARVLHNGVYKYSQAHVTVGPPPKLQLAASPNMILPGNQVLFVASAAGAPVRIDNWEFDSEGIQPTSCQAGSRECLTALPDGGIMRVYGAVDGVADSASAEIALATESCGNWSLTQLVRAPASKPASAAVANLCLQMSEAPWSGGMRLDSLCGDERDQIVAEYYDTTFFKPPTNQPGANWKPTCASFTQTDSTVYFKHPELRVNNPYAWSILQPSLLAPASLGYGLDRWRELIGVPRIINSAYRPPRYNRLGPARSIARGSRHMFGDAVDLRNESQTLEEWILMRDAARQTSPGYVEPVDGPCKLACTHADWRNHTNH